MTLMKGKKRRAHHDATVARQTDVVAAIVVATVPLKAKQSLAKKPLLQRQLTMYWTLRRSQKAQLCMTLPLPLTLTLLLKTVWNSPNLQRRPLKKWL